MKNNHIKYLILLSILVFGLCGCGDNSESIKSEPLTLSGESLEIIIDTSRNQEDTNYYSVMSGDFDSDTLENDSSIIGMEKSDINKIKSYAISSYGKD